MSEEINNKWAISHDGEEYYDTFPTREEAIAEGISNNLFPFWVGRCVPPPAPEGFWSADDWLDQVLMQDEYSIDAAIGWDADITKEHMRELETEVQQAIANYLDRHNLRPKFFVVEDVEQIDRPEEDT